MSLEADGLLCALCSSSCTLPAVASCTGLESAGQGLCTGFSRAMGSHGPLLTSGLCNGFPRAMGSQDLLMSGLCTGFSRAMGSHGSPSHQAFCHNNKKLSQNLSVVRLLLCEARLPQYFCSLLSHRLQVSNQIFFFFSNQIFLKETQS